MKSDRYEIPLPKIPAGQFLAAVAAPEDENSRREWLQIIHDREHSLLREIDPWMTVYDEVCRNIGMRRGRRKKAEVKGG